MKTLSLFLGCWMLVATCWGDGAPTNNAAPLTENLTIHIRGSFTDDSALDIQLSGAGPQFSCNLGDPPTKFQAALETTGDGKLVLSYVVAASSPSKSAGGTQFRDFALSGRVAVTYGEDIKIATIHGKDFFLTVSKYAKAKR